VRDRDNSARKKNEDKAHCEGVECIGGVGRASSFLEEKSLCHGREKKSHRKIRGPCQQARLYSVVIINPFLNGE
jgi:hypothetical protein